MNKTLESVWEQTLQIIQQQLNTPTYETWFKNMLPLGLEENTISVAVPSVFAKEWLEKRHHQMLEAALADVCGQEITLSLVVKEAGSKNLRSEDVIKKPRTSKNSTPANDKYTFDSFVIGSSNRFAHAAALAVAERPAEAYNPLFIYGGVGLGKTHLLQSISSYVINNHPKLRVKYVSTEKFTNDFINSIRDKEKISGFQNAYRNTDVLLIDDIQFLEKKEATQEEFFHTFNTLHESGKQIVITSDRPPRDISTLEDRLRSRFEWGLITDIQPPDLETRIAILKKRVGVDKLSVSNEVLEQIASRIQSNIRELEGALIRVVAFSSLTNTPISSELVSSVLKDIFPENNRPISYQKIQSEVCRYYNVSKVDLLGNRRSQSIVLPRQIAMYLTRELTDLSLPKIGDCFGGRDHTTVMHSYTKIEKMISQKREIYNTVQEITNKIKQV